MMRSNTHALNRLGVALQILVGAKDRLEVVERTCVADGTTVWMTSIWSSG